MKAKGLIERLIMPELPEAETIARALNRALKKRKIYAQKQCPVCKTPVAKVVLGGRTSWYCPNCQK